MRLSHVLIGAGLLGGAYWYFVLRKQGITLGEQMVANLPPVANEPGVAPVEPAPSPIPGDVLTPGAGVLGDTGTADAGVSDNPYTDPAWTLPSRVTQEPDTSGLVAPAYDYEPAPIETNPYTAATVTQAIAATDPTQDVARTLELDNPFTTTSSVSADLATAVEVVTEPIRLVSEAIAPTDDPLRVAPSSDPLVLDECIHYELFDGVSR